MYHTNNQVAEKLKISPTMASQLFTSGFEKLLKGVKRKMKSDKNQDISYLEIIGFMIREGYIVEKDIPKKIKKTLLKEIEYEVNR